MKYFTLKHYSAFLTSRLRFCSLDRNNSSCKIQRNKSAATVAFFSSPDRIAKRPQSHNRDGCVLSGNSSAALTTADFHHSAFHVCQTSCQRLTNSIHKKKKPSLVFQLLTAPDACWVNYSHSVHQGEGQFAAKKAHNGSCSHIIQRHSVITEFELLMMYMFLS